MRAENAPTTASRSAAGSTSASSSTLNPDPCSRANPSTSSGVYVEPPPTTAIFMCLPFHPGQRDSLDESLLREEEHDGDREHRQHGRGGHEVPLDMVEGAKRGEPERQRPVVFVLARVQQRA